MNSYNRLRMSNNLRNRITFIERHRSKELVLFEILHRTDNNLDETYINVLSRVNLNVYSCLSDIIYDTFYRKTS